jgi:hypothetical protein
MIITNSTADEFYFNQLLAFLTSMKINSPNHMMSIFLVNYPKDKENRLNEIFPLYKFENREINMVDDRGISLILSRIRLIKECFENYKEPVAWIDTDVIVRDDLTPFLASKPEQLKILFRGDDVSEKVRFNAGIFRIGYSNATYKLICDWEEGLRNNMVWGMGQLELYKAYKKNKDKVELVKMSKSYNDLGDSTNPDAFAPDSLLWHSKKFHFENHKFQKEFQMYLRKGLSYGK